MVTMVAHHDHRGLQSWSRALAGLVPAISQIRDKRHNDNRPDITVHEGRNTDREDFQRVNDLAHHIQDHDNCDKCHLIGPPYEHRIHEGRGRIQDQIRKIRPIIPPYQAKPLSVWLFSFSLYVAERLQVNIRTAQKIIRSIPHINIDTGKKNEHLRITEDMLEEYINARIVMPSRPMLSNKNPQIVPRIRAAGTGKIARRPVR